MKVPLEITYRDVEKNNEIDELIRRKAEKLEQVCGHLVSCRVAIEQPQKAQSRGRPYRVRIDMRVPPGHELVVSSDPNRGDMHQPLEAVVRQTFETARRQLQQLVDKQRGHVKQHPDQQVQALVHVIFPEQNYGFIQDPEGQEIYFHRNAVLNGDFEKLRVGMGVRYVAVMGEKGPQATTVQIEAYPERI